MRSQSLSLGLALILSFACFSVAAEPSSDQSGTSPAPAVAPASSATDDKTNTSLQGAVVQISVTLNDLRDARLAVSRARKATANLYDEVTRQQVTTSYNPNMIGTTLIMMPRVEFSGAYLPARPKWVKASMAEIGPIIELFKEDVDAAIASNRRTDVSEETRHLLDPLRDDAFTRVKTSFDLYNQLQSLTAGGVIYNNQEIATAAKGLDNEMKELDKSLKRGISVLQKEAKSLKKA